MDLINELTRVLGANYTGCSSIHRKAEMFVFDPSGENPVIIHDGSNPELLKQLRVANQNGQYYFIAVDFCLTIDNTHFLKPNGNMADKCDCIIYNSNVLYFIEIKDRKKKAVPVAINEALKQIEKTITVFQNIGIDFIGTRQKVVAFTARRQFNNEPFSFSASKGSKKAYFKQTYNIELEDSFEIILN